MPAITLVNDTLLPLHIALKQVSPLYYANNVPPGGEVTFHPGKVFFTVEARIARVAKEGAPSDNAYTPWDTYVPIVGLSLVGVSLGVGAIYLAGTAVAAGSVAATAAAISADAVATIPTLRRLYKYAKKGQRVVQIGQVIGIGGGAAAVKKHHLLHRKRAKEEEPSETADQNYAEKVTARALKGLLEGSVLKSYGWYTNRDRTLRIVGGPRAAEVDGYLVIETDTFQPFRVVDEQGETVAQGNEAPPVEESKAQETEAQQQQDKAQTKADVPGATDEKRDITSSKPDDAEGTSDTPAIPQGNMSAYLPPQHEVNQPWKARVAEASSSAAGALGEWKSYLQTQAEARWKEYQARKAHKEAHKGEKGKEPATKEDEVHKELQDLHLDSDEEIPPEILAESLRDAHAAQTSEEWEDHSHILSQDPESYVREGEEPAAVHDYASLSARLREPSESHTSEDEREYAHAYEHDLPPSLYNEPTALEKLLEMGFSYEVARRALHDKGGDLALALDELISSPAGPSNPPAKEGPPLPPRAGEQSAPALPSRGTAQEAPPLPLRSEEQTHTATPATKEEGASGKDTGGIPVEAGPARPGKVLPLKNTSELTGHEHGSWVARASSTAARELEKVEKTPYVGSFARAASQGLKAHGEAWLQGTHQKGATKRVAVSAAKAAWKEGK